MGYSIDTLQFYVYDHSFYFLGLTATIGLTLILFRHQIFYSSYQHQVKVSDKSDLSFSFGDYIESLLANPSTRKQKISHDLVNNIYLTNIDTEEKISIKRYKEWSLVFKILSQLVTHGPVWLFKHQAFEKSTLAIKKSEIQKQSIVSNGLLLSQNNVQARICTHHEACLDLNKSLLDSILINIPEINIDCGQLNNLQREEIFKKNLKPIVHFIRGAGYFHYRHLLEGKVDWNNPELFKTVTVIGAILDPILFRVRIRIARYSNEALSQSSKADLIIIEYRSNAFFSVQQTARGQFERVQDKFNEAKAKAKNQLKSFNNELSDYFFDSQASIIETIAEEKEVKAADPEVHAKDKKIAKIFLKTLEELGKLTIQQALRHPLVIASNKFIKASSPVHLSELYTPLQTQVTAAKLGLDPIVFNSNPGFEQFARKIHIHRYLFVFQHEIKVDDQTCIWILFQGKLSRWENIRDKLKYDEVTGLFLGYYAMDGIVNYGLYDWDKLKPFKVEKENLPPWGNRYLCEICSWIIDKPRVSGDHTFLRLKTPRGEWYSVGQYVPSKLGYDRFVFPMSLKPSRFMSPDVSEFWNGNFTTLSFEITEKQFHLMKEKIEADKRNQLHLYQVFNDNCTIWAKSIAELADLDIPSSLAVYDILFPDITSLGRKIHRWKYTPKFLKPVIKLWWTFILNLFGLVLGSGMVNKQVKSDPNFQSAVPFIRSFMDLFDTKKGVSEHPFIIGHYVQRQVETWREARTKILLEKKKIVEDKIIVLSAPNSPSISLESPACIPPLELSEPLIQYFVDTLPTVTPEYPTAIISPFSSPRLTPSTKSNSLEHLTRQLQLLNLAIEATQYAVPDRFKRLKRTLSTSSLPSLVSPLDSQGNVSNDY